MSGRKTFVAGEVLQAADVNDFLMDQSVMVFAGSAARGSAITSPTEGMVTYLSDSDEVEVFDGSVYKPVGGLVAVKHVLKTDTFSAAVGAGATTDVTGLSIIHAMSNPSNKLIISAYFGVAASSNQRANVGLAVVDGATFIGVGDAAGSRTRVSAGGVNVFALNNEQVVSHSVQFVYEPGDTASHTYVVRAVNIRTETQTLFVNRSEIDTSGLAFSRGSSGFVIQEVSV